MPAGAPVPMNLIDLAAGLGVIPAIDLLKQVQTDPGAAVVAEPRTVALKVIEPKPGPAAAHWAVGPRILPLGWSNRLDRVTS